jgi:hypothetical protein
MAVFVLVRKFAIRGTGNDEIFASTSYARGSITSHALEVDIVGILEEIFRLGDDER